MNKLSDFWEKKVPKGWKHFPKEMNKKSLDFSIKKFNENTINMLDLKSIDTCIDWGCGGGLLSKQLLNKKKEIDLHLVDISKESILHAHQFLEKDYPYFITETGISHVNIQKECDLLFCYSVIQHFPSIEYWEQVSKHWSENIRPKFISIRTKIGEQSYSNPNYYEGSEYLRGTILDWEQMMKNFDDYKILNKKEDLTGSGQKDGFLLLERK